jgi:hypothetical protein
LSSLTLFCDLYDVAEYRCFLFPWEALSCGMKGEIQVD